MSNLDWIELERKFYSLRGIAEKLGFYNEEIQRMEHSLWECCPPTLKNMAEHRQ